MDDVINIICSFFLKIVTFFDFLTLMDIIVINYVYI